MSRAITVSDDLFSKLEKSARAYGLPNIERLLETWQSAEDERCRRRAAVQELRVIRERVYEAHGELPDSLDLIREDRAR
jgi:hypothetical protein